MRGVRHCHGSRHRPRGGPQAAYAAARDWARRSSRDGSVARALDAAEDAAPADFQTQQGWVLIALQNAFFRLLHAPNLEEGVVATVMAGGDTDTNAAIAGALLGAVHGRDAVPARWRAAVVRAGRAGTMPPQILDRRRIGRSTRWTSRSACSCSRARRGPALGIRN